MGVLSASKWVAAALLAVPLVHGLDTDIDVNGVEYNVSSTTLGEAASIVDGIELLTDDVVTNLTTIQLQNATLFDFASNTTVAKRSTRTCKVAPGDAAWPSTIIWDIFDILLGGALIPTTPLASPCYDSWGNEDATLCATITSDWSNSTIHADHPTSVMYPLNQGRTCLPVGDNVTDTCTLGGYPSYAVNVSNVAQIQLAVNFARNANLRLVVKNTGHDFNGKSSGAGALSIWTHNLKSTEYIPNYSTDYYTGPAAKVGSGIQATELYAFCDANEITCVGGEGRTVGVAGGYVAGGGHSPMSSVHGMAADQVLEMEVVTPDGRFVTVSATENTDLYWGLRGGGGSTYGVVVSVTNKVYPQTIVTVMTFTFEVEDNVTVDIFWEGAALFFDNFVDFTDAGCYAYWSILTSADDGWTFSMSPFFAPNMTAAELTTLTATWFAGLSALGISITPVITEYDNFYDAWWNSFPLEGVGYTDVKTASRLLPESNFANSTALNATVAALREVALSSAMVLGFMIKAADNDGNDNAVNPAWRTARMHVLTGAAWDLTATTTELLNATNSLTYDTMQVLRDVAPSPGGGVYQSESDINEPDYIENFYGSAYDRLYAMKQTYDPSGLFYAPTAVGAEDWYITDQVTGLPTQNGNLCPVAST